MFFGKKQSGNIDVWWLYDDGGNYLCKIQSIEFKLFKHMYYTIIM